jgi:hypothetical protein
MASSLMRCVPRLKEKETDKSRGGCQLCYIEILFCDASFWCNEHELVQELTVKIFNVRIVHCALSTTFTQKKKLKQIIFYFKTPSHPTTSLVVLCKGG